MRVLLISPLKTLDPPGGDVTYTHLLLSDPPDNVLYDTYEEALNSGLLIEHGRFSSIRLPNQVIFEFILWCFLQLINCGRRSRILFWEPFRFFSVKPGVYDLVHLHMFGVRFISLDCPLIVSNSISHHFLYRDARKYSNTKLALLEATERFLCSVTGVVHPSYRVDKVDSAIAFTGFMKSWYTELRVLAPALIEVIPPYLPHSASPHSAKKDLKIGFAANDFDVKGGPALLAAFTLVREVYPDCVLHIVGSTPRLTKEEAARRNIIWEPAVEHDRLLKVILPEVAVFAYPTEFDGFPLIVLDVLSQGIPVVCSNYPPLAELIQHEVDGLVCFTKEPQELANNIIALLEPAVNARYSANVLRRFNERFSAPVVKPRLTALYERIAKRVS